MSVKDKLKGLEKGDTFHVMDISDYPPTEKDRNLDEEFFHGDHTIKK